MKWKLLILCTILPGMGLLFPLKGAPQSFLKGTDGAKKTPTVIQSQSLEIDNKQRVVTFLGGVDAKRDTFTLQCEKLILHYENPKEQKGERNPTKGELKIVKMIATGDVRITRPNGGLATSEQATYYQNEEKVVLTGKPVVKQGEDFVEGSVVTLFLKEERSMVEGAGDQKVRAVLSPRSSGR